MKNRTGITRSFFPIPLMDFHLSEESGDKGFTGNRAYVYLFGSVALFILLIAGVNYVNLATARASLRSKEVGIRKTMGALRRQVAGQFIGESVILSVFSYLVGGMIALWILPYFNRLFGTSLLWHANLGFLGLLLVAAVGIGVLAGLYPALYLSGFAPSQVLRSNNDQGRSGSLLRMGLVVGQFAMALVLIIGSLIVYKQIRFTQDKDLGFDGEQVVMVNLPTREAWDQREVIRNNLAGYAGINELSLSMGAPGEFNIRMGNQMDKLAPENNMEPDEQVIFAPAVVDYNFLDLLDIEVVAGRNFSKKMGSDAENAYIINKKGAEMLGWTPEEAIGKQFGGRESGTVIGVTENFHISSLHDEIEGIYLQLSQSGSFYSGGIVLAKLDPAQIRKGVDRIMEEVAQFAPHSKVSYEFLDDKFDAMYRTEIRFGKIVGLFTIMAILIACMGLYGLAAFSAERRVREIGIRKVLGATVRNIVVLLSKFF